MRLEAAGNNPAPDAVLLRRLGGNRSVSAGGAPADREADRQDVGFALVSGW